MIEVKKLVKTYHSGLKAVNDLNLSIKQGEIMGLLGPNGAGKTTTVRILSTLSGFDAGSVQVAGMDVDRDPDGIRHNIGYVAQKTGVDFFLTGRENLSLQGHMYHLPTKQIQQRIAELADYFGLNDHLDETVATYSGGQQRKLDIATALIHRPKVLFLDEPTLGLDIQSRHNLWQLIRKLNMEQGLTILLTTHYLEEADQLAHRVAIINKGQVVVCDTPDNLKKDVKGEGIVLSFHNSGDENSRRFIEHIQTLEFVKEQLWENDKLHLYVENGASALSILVNEASGQNVGFKHIELAQPSLDDVFLKYTGNRIDGEEQEQEPWWKQWADKGWGGKGKWSKWQNQENQQADSPPPQDGGDSADQSEQADWKKWQNQGKTGQETDQQADSQDSGGGEADWQQWKNNEANSGDTNSADASSGNDWSEDQKKSWSGWQDDKKQSR